MDELRFHNMGQRAVTFAFNVGEEGKLGVSLYVSLWFDDSLYIAVIDCASDRYDFNDQVGDKSVKLLEDMYPDQLRAFYGVIWNYASYAHKIDASTPTQALGIKRKKRCMRHPGIGRRGGYPVFIPVGEKEAPKLSDNKDLVRIFLNQHYGAFFPPCLSTMLRIC